MPDGVWIGDLQLETARQKFNNLRSIKVAESKLRIINTLDGAITPPTPAGAKTASP